MVSATRIIVGPTKGYDADAGSIRGDLSLSIQSNVVLFGFCRERKDRNCAFL